jgi:LacI family transcriptional regulator
MNLSYEKLNRILQNRGIRGLIIAPLKKSRARLKLDWGAFSSITLGHSLVHPRLNRVAHDLVRSMITIMRRLRQLGYRRIGLAIPDELEERNNYGWYAGYSVEARRISSENQIPWFRLPPLKNKEQFCTWIKQHKPEVIVSFNDHLVEILEKKLKMKVPQKIGFAHVNLSDTSGTFSGIYQKPKTIGEAAIELLVGMLQRNECGLPQDPRVTLIEGDWIEGKTIRSLISKK